MMTENDIKKVIDWINKNIDKYIWFDESEVSSGDCCGLTDDWEDDFKNAMKE